MAEPYKKSVTRYRTPDGKTCPKETAGAVISREELKGYYGSYKTGEGKRVEVALCPDLTRSRQMLNKLLGDAAMGKAGMTDPFAEFADKPLAELVADYGKTLNRKKDTPDHIERTARNILAAIEGSRASRLADLDAEKVADFLGERMQEGKAARLPAGVELFTGKEVRHLLGLTRDAIAKAIRNRGLGALGNGKTRRYPRATVKALADRKGKGIGAETFNHYVRACKSFGQWLLMTKRWDSNPFATLALLNVATDKRHQRRALGREEVVRLFETTGASKRPFRELDGASRRLLYMVAIMTGFRLGTLAKLTPDQFHLDGNEPGVTLPASMVKNKKRLTRYFAADDAEELRAYLADRPRVSPLWPGTWKDDAAEMLHADLIDAGIPIITNGPEGQLHIDFHAMRHTYATLEREMGSDAETVSRKMGHANPGMTARYTHHKAAPQVAAAEQLRLYIHGEQHGKDGVENRSVG